VPYGDYQRTPCPGRGRGGATRQAIANGVTVLEPPERGALLRYPINEDLAFLRRQVHDYVTALGLGERQRMDFVLAVNEALGNVLDHANAAGTLTLGHDAEHVTAEISDTAGLLTDANAGRTPPPPGANRGYGLWLMRQLCDSVEISADANGSLVRLRMRRPGIPHPRVEHGMEHGMEHGVENGTASHSGLPQG
jgi:anti-sigma regulatory factor (Ser/Thr protein kinase)